MKSECYQCSGTGLDETKEYECSDCSGRRYAVETEASDTWSTAEMKQVENEYWRSIL